LVEAKTIAFIAPAENQHFPGLEGGDPVIVANPLSTELSELRRSLLPGLLGALRFNLNRESAAFHAFEIGKVFVSREGAVSEAERIAGISYGDYAMRSIGRPAVKADFFSVKGILETCFRTFGIHGLSFEAAGEGSHPYLHPGRSANIVRDGKLLGIVGELHPADRLKLELSSACVLFELDLRDLIAYGSNTRQIAEPPPRFPAVRRDLALILDRDFPAEHVLRTISGLNLPLLETVELFDVYEGEPIPPGKKSVAIACRYRARDRTLTDEGVNRAHAALIEEAKSRLGAELRD
jgi:phenylalanyl-tRNA synthetase beta chain